MPAPIALVDCNNFYASCERVFQPTLYDACFNPHKHGPLQKNVPLFFMGRLHCPIAVDLVRRLPFRGGTTAWHPAPWRVKG